MRVRVMVAVLVNSVFIKLDVQRNGAAGAHLLNMGIPCTNRKLTSIHSESVPRGKSEAVAFKLPKKLNSSL